MINMVQSHAALGIIYLESGYASGLKEDCPVCGSASLPYLNVPSVVEGVEMLYLRCENCESIHLSGETRGRNFYATVPSEALKHYLEIGAGPDFMFRLLRGVMRSDVKTFCSVGCGVGFDLDIVARFSNGEITAVGFEPNSYGAVEDLDVEIRTAVLDDAWLHSNNERFDVVFASEVVEHVEFPVLFCESMRKALAPTGVLILTTPNAKFIGPQSRAGDAYAALFPGEHKIIFTKAALLTILKNSGFKNVRIVEEEHRLSAFASDAPISEEYGRGVDADIRDDYIKYLKALVESKPINSLSPMVAGACYRLFQELVNLGCKEEALQLLLRQHALSILCEMRDGFPVIAPSIVQKLLQIEQFEDHVRSLRGFIAPFSYYLAMMAFLFGRVDLAANGFDIALKLLRKDEVISPFYFQVSVSLIAPCKKEFMNTLSQSGQAERLCSFIASEKDLLDDKNTRSTLIATILRSFIDLSNAGKWPMAKELATLIDQKFLRRESLGTIFKINYGEDIKLPRALMFDYCISRGYYQINSMGDRESFADYLARAAVLFLSVPSLHRISTLLHMVKVFFVIR